MANTEGTLQLEVKITPEHIEEIKKDLFNDIIEVAEFAYKEGYADMDPGAPNKLKRDASWKKSETYRKIQELLEK